MKKWFVFVGDNMADICLATNYKLFSESKPNCIGISKVCAILAEDDGSGLPIINSLQLKKDFVHSIQSESDYGMVALNCKYKKKDHLAVRIFERIIGVFK